jgi:chemotaxis protein MotB
MRPLSLAVLGTLMLLNTGCVTKKTHEATLTELEKTRETLGFAKKTIEEQDHILKQNEIEIARTNEELLALNTKKSALQVDLSNAQTQLDGSRSQLNTFQKQLSDVQRKLDESQSQIQTLRNIEIETKKRNEIYARFISELQKMIDGGQLSVSINEGRIVINLPDNVLFPSGSATLSVSGRETLKEIAALLGEFSDRRFQIEGHTDNVPIYTPKFPSNWELSTARALSVVQLMTKEGVIAENLSAAGFGEFHPRADNTSKEGRALNRRIEIVMQPNLNILSNELPKVVE